MRCPLLRGERRLLLLTGEELRSVARQHAEQLWLSGGLWLGNGPDSVMSQPMQHTMSWLGQEYPLVILNAFCGLSPDMLGAVGGTVRAGGLLVLLMPPLADWPQFADPDYRRYVSQPEEVTRCYPHFLQRLQGLLTQDGSVWHWDLSSGTLHHPLPELPAAEWQIIPDRTGCLSTEQHHARDAVLAWCNGRQTVSTGGDGVIAAAASQRPSAWRHSNCWHRVNASSSPRPPSTGAHLTATCRSASAPFFYSPEALLEQDVPADLLLIDEAAAIPAALLRQLQQRYQRVVYATTIHGYEGSGHGFELRMCRWLASQWPQWQQVTLTAPLRWAASDPLEPLLARILLLDADACEPPAPASALKAECNRITPHNCCRMKTCCGSCSDC